MIFAEIFGMALVVWAISATVAWIFKKLGYRERHAYWIAGGITGILLSLGKLKGAAYELARRTPSVITSQETATEFQSWANLDAQRCRLVLGSAEMINFAVLQFYFALVVVVLWFVCKLIKRATFHAEALGLYVLATLATSILAACLGAIGAGLTVIGVVLFLCIWLRKSLGRPVTQ